MVTNKRKLKIYFKQEIIRLREELQIARLQRTITERFQGDKGDAAIRFLERTRLNALIEHLGGQLMDMERALEKLDNRTYGLCDACGGMIPLARLEVIPHASLCLNCKNSRSKNIKPTQQIAV